MLIPALFETRILDFSWGKDDVETGPNWELRSRNGAEEFWQAYLAYRVQNEVDPKLGHYVEIRRIANEVHALAGEPELELRQIIEALCWLTLSSGVVILAQRRGHETDDIFRVHLLCAAAYLGLDALARTLLDQNVSPSGRTYIFPSPMWAATWTGRAHLLELFQERVPKYEELDANPHTRVINLWHGKMGPSSVSAAAKLGDMAMLRLALSPPSQTPGMKVIRPNGKDIDLRTILRPYPESSFPQSTPEVAEYLEVLAEVPWDAKKLRGCLRDAISTGNLRMVSYALDRGAELHPQWSYPTPESISPLAYACQFNHEHIVDLLLDRGADPNHVTAGKYGGSWPAVVAASATGNLSVVRKLLDHGADPNLACMYPRMPALAWAYLLEHEKMIDLLQERGATLDILDGAQYPNFDSCWMVTDILVYFEMDSMLERLAADGWGRRIEDARECYRDRTRPPHRACMYWPHPFGSWARGLPDDFNFDGPARQTAFLEWGY